MGHRMGWRQFIALTGGAAASPPAGRAAAEINRRADAVADVVSGAIDIGVTQTEFSLEGPRDLIASL